MKKKLLNIMKAFATGFVIVALILLILMMIAPVVGVKYTSTFSPTFIIERKSVSVIYLSWFAPILIGIIFAIFQIIEDFEQPLAKMYKKIVKNEEIHDVLFVLWNGVWGLAVGFVISMFLLAILVGTTGYYFIPMLFSAQATGNTIRGTTAITAFSTILGLLYGVWQVGHKKLSRKNVKKKTKKK